MSTSTGLVWSCEASAPGSAAVAGGTSTSVPPEQSEGNTEVLPKSVEIAVTSPNERGVEPIGQVVGPPTSDGAPGVP